MSELLPPSACPHVPAEIPASSEPAAGPALPSSPELPAPALPPNSAESSDDGSDDADDLEIRLRYSYPQAARLPVDFHLLPPPPQAPSARELHRQLTTEQLRVLHELASGKSVGAAAETLGIHRGTVYRWLNSDPAFRAAYNAWRQELIELGRSRLLKGSEAAVETVLSAVEKGDARIALSLLKELGVLSRPNVGSADVGYAHTEQELDRRAERARLARRSQRLFREECLSFPDLTHESLERMTQIAAGLNPDDKPPMPPIQVPTDPKSVAKAREQAKQQFENLLNLGRERMEEEDEDDD